jgi:hypothetical protein
VTEDDWNDQWVVWRDHSVSKLFAVAGVVLTLFGLLVARFAEDPNALAAGLVWLFVFTPFAWVCERLDCG